MKVVFIITDLSAGGAQIMLLRLIRGLDRRFVTPHVISLAPSGVIGDRIAEAGVPVESMEMRPSLPSPTILFRLAAKLRRLQPDVVQCWMYHADCLGGVAAWMARVPVVLWGIRNADLDPVASKKSTMLIVRACALLSRWVPDRILSCSDVARNVHVELGYDPRKMVVIPNGFDLRAYAPDPEARRAVRAELGLPADATLVGLFGRFDPQKNHLGFLEVCATLRAQADNIHFVLAGSGIDPGNREIVQRINVLSLESSVHLLGYRSDVPRLLAALDVLVSASSYGEAFPNVLGEAMACSVPCVATDVGDSAYIVGEFGRIVPRGDMAALTGAILDLLEMSPVERERLKRGSRSRIANEFAIEDVVGRYMDLYRGLTRCLQSSG